MLYRSARTMLSMGAVLLVFLVGTHDAYGDDAYEQNDSLAAAYDISGSAKTWLSTIAGNGQQSDNDWYEIYVDGATYERVLVFCEFVDWLGNIDIALYDSSGTLLIASTSTTDNELLTFGTATSGTHYIRVYGASAGNAYDLWWDSNYFLADDPYEPNDSMATAHPLPEATWLTEDLGMGLQYDDDWYEIQVGPTDYERVQIHCRFAHAHGNTDMDLSDSSGALLARSDSTTDDEYIDFVVPAPGTYYVGVHGDNSTDAYDLRWNSVYHPYWAPREWVWFDWPDACELWTGHWLHFAPGGDLFCTDMAAILWEYFGPANLASGWVYFDWPYAYSLNEGTWYFMSDSGEQWVFNYANPGWKQLGSP